MKVLIAEYDPAVRAAVKETILSKYINAEIEEVSSTEEFLQKEFKSNWECIISKISCSGFLNVCSKSTAQKLTGVPLFVLTPVPVLQSTKFSFLKKFSAMILIDNLKNELSKTLEKVFYTNTNQYKHAA